jgi:hypothetical protein
MNTKQIAKAQTYYRETFGVAMDKADIQTISKCKSADDVYDANEAGEISNGVADAADWAFCQ